MNGTIKNSVRKISEKYLFGVAKVLFLEEFWMKFFHLLDAKLLMKENCPCFMSHPVFGLSSNPNFCKFEGKKIKK